jgi:hypothetical protein
LDGWATDVRCEEGAFSVEGKPVGVELCDNERGMSAGRRWRGDGEMICTLSTYWSWGSSAC